MRKSDIDVVREKCTELLRRLEELEYTSYQPLRCVGGRASASVKRQSMELSHALADMRRPWRDMGK